MNKLNKMKSFLFDEEDDEKEVKKPSKKKEKAEEKIERKDKVEIFEPEQKDSIEKLDFDDVPEETIKVPSKVHSRTEKVEQKFSFPEFDDEDFMVASKKPEPIIPVKKEEPKRVLYQGSRRKEETKKFKPSPIISPIYGLLDNQGNSIKEEVGSDKSSKSDEVTIDEVRKKAYGALDDELEDTIKRLSTKTIEEAEKEIEVENRELSREKKKREKINEEKPVVASLDDEEDDNDMILPNVNFKEIDVDKETKKTSKKQIKKKESVKSPLEEDDDDDDTKEQDLFNLIDTMYQNKEDEE